MAVAYQTLPDGSGFLEGPDDNGNYRLYKYGKNPDGSYASPQNDPNNTPFASHSEVGPDKTTPLPPGVKYGSYNVSGKGSPDSWNPIAVLADDVKKAVKGVAGINDIDTPPPVGPQPGVGVAAAPGTKLTQDPTTGLFVDPATGTSYTDATGATPVKNQNLAQQQVTNAATRNAFLAKIGATDQTLDKVQADQQRLQGTLQRTIEDPNAPSVAATQLAQATDANGRAILGTAAGVGGANAYDARRNAAQVLADANTKAAGNAALLRQKEVADATTALSGNLTSQGTAAQKRQDTSLATAADYNKVAAGTQSDQQRIDADIATKNADRDEKADEANQTMRAKVGGAGLKALSGQDPTK